MASDSLNQISAQQLQKKSKLNLMESSQLKESLLNGDVRIATDLSAQKQGQMQSLQQTVEEVQTINALLGDTQVVRLSDEERVQLQSLQNRNLAHVLLNQTKTFGDSKEMTKVKNAVHAVEERLGQELEGRKVTAETLTKLYNDYEAALQACDAYCRTKTPRYESGKKRKAQVEAERERLLEEMQDIAVARLLLSSGVIGEQAYSMREVLVQSKVYRMFGGAAENPGPAEKTEPPTEQEIASVPEQLRNFVRIFALTASPSELVGKAGDDTARELMELRNSLREMQAGKCAAAAVCIKGQYATVTVNEKGEVRLMSGEKEIAVPYSLEMITQRMEADMLLNEKLFGQDFSNAVIGEMPEDAIGTEDTDKLQLIRTICSNFLQGRAGLKSAQLSAFSTQELRRYAQYIASGDMTVEEVTAQMKELDEAELINGAETIELRGMMDAGRAKAKEKVKMAAPKQRVLTKEEQEAEDLRKAERLKEQEEEEKDREEAEKDLEQEEKDQAEASKDAGGGFLGFFNFFSAFQKQETEEEKAARLKKEEEEKKVRAAQREINKEAREQRKKAREERQKVREEHALMDRRIEHEPEVRNFLADMIYSKETWETDGKLFDPDKRIAKVLQNNMSALVYLIQDPGMIDVMVGNLPLPQDEIELEDGNTVSIGELIKDAFLGFLEGPEISMLKGSSDFVITSALKVALSSERMQSTFAELDQKINESIEMITGGIQTIVRKCVDGVLGGEGGKVAPLAEEKVEPLGTIEEIEAEERAQARQVVRQAAPQQQQAQKPAEPDPGDLRVNISSLKLKKGLSAEERERRQKERDRRKRLGETKLNKILTDAVESDKGQGAFIKNVMRYYFGSMPAIDKRSMLASAIRETSLVRRTAEPMDEQEKKKVMGTFLGGYMKGAGPLMQKMMQGLPEKSVPEVLRPAIASMKSKLAPIPEEVVRSQLLGMVNRSGGKISSIDVVKPLGAASVGQTFLCKVHGPAYGEDGQEVVVKLLRPDVRNRMMREKDVMLRCARKAGKGMYHTYVGQLQRIEEELDLTIEGRNVQIGKLYDKPLESDQVEDDVKSMKLAPVVSSTANSMMLEKAPGSNVSDVMEETEAELIRIIGPVAVLDEKGNITYDEKGLPVIDSAKLKGSKLDRAALADQLKKLQNMQPHLLHLAEKWISEALYGSGFYHGDLHAGNIMITEEGATVIDFGNATQLDVNQKAKVTRMMVAAAVGDTDVFVDDFIALMENTPKEFINSKKGAFREQVKEIFGLGDNSTAGLRIAAALSRAQDLGLELPPAIANLSACQLRLSNTIDAMNAMMDKIQHALNETDPADTNLLPSYAYDIASNFLEVAANDPDKSQILPSLKQAQRDLRISDPQEIQEQAKKARTEEEKDRFWEEHMGKKDPLYAIGNAFSLLIDSIDSFKVMLQNMPDAILTGVNHWFKDNFKSKVAGGALFDHFFDNGSAVYNELAGIIQRLNETKSLDELEAFLNRMKPLCEPYKLQKELTNKWKEGEEPDPELLKEFAESYTRVHEQYAAKMFGPASPMANMYEPGQIKDARPELESMYFVHPQYGEQCRAAFEDYAAFVTEHGNVNELEGELKEQAMAKQKVFFDVYRRIGVDRLKEHEKFFAGATKVVKQDDEGYSTDFYGVMGRVINDNLKGTLSVLGTFKALKYSLFYDLK